MATCSECTYLKVNGECNYGKYWCETRLEWHYANEASCYRYCEAYSRSSEVARSYYEKSERSQNSGGTCAISTVFEILGLADNHIYLNVLRVFRKKELQGNEKYRELLVNYDIIGPIIASKLTELPNKEKVAKNLFDLGITKMVDLIINDKAFEAVKLYNDLINILIEGLNIKIQPTEEEIKNADISNAGHGVYIKKRKTA